MDVQTLIDRFGLQPHPEGGHYAETYRAATRVLRGNDQRAAGTHILYLLATGELSRWHRIVSDELWHLYAGGPLELHLMAADFSNYRVVVLDREPPEALFVAQVPAGHWQAARPLGDYALMGCTVMPGFEFVEFEMLADLPEAKKRFFATASHLAYLL